MDTQRERIVVVEGEVVTIQAVTFATLIGRGSQPKPNRHSQYQSWQGAQLAHAPCQRWGDRAIPDTISILALGFEADRPSMVARWESGRVQ